MPKRNKPSQNDYSKRVKTPQMLDLNVLIQQQRTIEFRQAINDLYSVPSGFDKIKHYFTSRGYSEADIELCLHYEEGITALEALYSAYFRLEKLGFSLIELKILILFPQIALKINILLGYSGVLLAIGVSRGRILNLLISEKGEAVLSRISRYALQLNNVHIPEFEMIKLVNQSIAYYLKPPIAMPPKQKDTLPDDILKIIEDLLAQNFNKEALGRLAHRENALTLFQNLFELYKQFKGKVTPEQLITIANKNYGCPTLTSLKKCHSDLLEIGFTLDQIISLASKEGTANIIHILWRVRDKIKDPKQSNTGKNRHELSIEESIYLATNINDSKILERMLLDKETFSKSKFSLVDMLTIGKGDSGYINLQALKAVKAKLLDRGFTTENLVSLASLKEGKAALLACDHLIALGFHPDDIVQLALISKGNDRIQDAQNYTQQLLDTGRYTMKRILTILKGDKTTLKEEVDTMHTKASSNKTSFFAHFVAADSDVVANLLSLSNRSLD